MKSFSDCGQKFWSNRLEVLSVPKQFDKIKQAAMTLSPNERVLLADQLYMSVSEKEQADIEAEWVAEAERRIREVDEGRAKTIPGDQVLAEARALLKK